MNITQLTVKLLPTDSFILITSTQIVRAKQSNSSETTNMLKLQGVDLSYTVSK